MRRIPSLASSPWLHSRCRAKPTPAYPIAAPSSTSTASACRIPRGGATARRFNGRSWTSTPCGWSWPIASSRCMQRRNRRSRAQPSAPHTPPAPTPCKRATGSPLSPAAPRPRFRAPTLLHKSVTRPRAPRPRASRRSWRTTWRGPAAAALPCSRCPRASLVAWPWLTRAERAQPAARAGRGIRHRESGTRSRCAASATRSW
mmetsp:Transcript_419/g.900  ORF Transcript_419/g.900 Transcript_419/m.900 type:complete len:202 (+) Transcript_419:302-907(+)